MPVKHDASEDRNFDDLAERFKRKIYASPKGYIRLAILERDLGAYMVPDTPPLRILDAGGGQGQLSLALAKMGHEVSICDVSSNMLNHARRDAENLALNNTRFHHCPLQEVSRHLDQPQDLILCHAVMEWMAKPHTVFDALLPLLSASGKLSLTFFNVNSIILKNTQRGNFEKVIGSDFRGQKGSLTPINPLTTETVINWCREQQLNILQHSGIRVFYDYLENKQLEGEALRQLIESELLYSTREPFRSLGRYIHLLLSPAK